jgi:hypothetical protein
VSILPTTLDVPSRPEWVETPVWVKAGDSLDFHAQGHWVDLVIPCTADGYAAGFFYAIHEPPRIPDEGRYFRLMGRISTDGKQPADDDKELTFPIGVHRTGWKANTEGRLFVFANDRKGFYWNNWGAIRLTIVPGVGYSS